MSFKNSEEFVIEYLDTNKKENKNLEIDKGDTIINIRKKIYDLFGKKDDHELFINKTFHLNRFYDPLEIKSFYPLMHNKIITINKSKGLLENRTNTLFGFELLLQKDPSNKK